jgi:hypothetical protein
MSPCAGALLPIHAGATVLLPVLSYAIRVVCVNAFRGCRVALGCFDNPAFVPLSTSIVKTFSISREGTLASRVSLSIKIYVNLS